MMINLLLEGFEQFNYNNTTSTFGSHTNLGGLYKAISEVGGAMMHIEKRVGIWCALLAVIFLAFTIMFITDYNRRRFLKSHVARVIICICLFFALTSIVILIANSGLD